MVAQDALVVLIVELHQRPLMDKVPTSHTTLLAFNRWEASRYMRNIRGLESHPRYLLWQSFNNL